MKLSLRFAGALEAGAVAGGQCEVVELDGMTPASRGPVIADGWDEGMTAMREALTGIANRDREQRAAAGRPGPPNRPYTSTV
ncbi:hypothetical protein ACWC0A_32000 [Streptomyces scopuliridis]